MKFLHQLLTDDRWVLHRRWLLGAIWVTLFALTHIPIPPSVQGLGVSDKLVHLVGYFPLGLLLPLCRVPGCQSMWRCLLVVASYGIVDELLQIPVGRTASLLDWLADVLGIVIGLVMARLLVKTHR